MNHLEGVTSVHGWNRVQKGRNREFVQGLFLKALKVELSMLKACNVVGINRNNVLSWIREQPDFKSKYLAIREEQERDPDHLTRKGSRREDRPKIEIESANYYLPAVSMRFINSTEKIDENTFVAIGKDGAVKMLFDGNFFYYQSMEFPFEASDQQLLYNKLIKVKRK